MSHNLYTLNNAGGDVLSYHTVSKGILYFGRGSTSNYPGSFPSASPVAFEWYAPASERVNTIGATFGTGSASGWINSITFPAGRYLFYFYCYVPTVNTTSGPDLSYIATYENSVYDGSYNIYNHSNASVNGSPSSDSWASKIVREYSVSTTLTFQLGRTSSNAALSDAGNRISQHQFFFVRKL